MEASVTRFDWAFGEFERLVREGALPSEIKQHFDNLLAVARSSQEKAEVYIQWAHAHANHGQWQQAADTLRHAWGLVGRVGMSRHRKGRIKYRWAQMFLLIDEPNLKSAFLCAGHAAEHLALDPVFRGPSYRLFKEVVWRLEHANAGWLRRQLHAGITGVIAPEVLVGPQEW